MRQILVKGHEVLVKMHILKKKTSRLEKLEGAMDEYQKTAEYLLFFVFKISRKSVWSGLRDIDWLGQQQLFIRR